MPVAGVSSSGGTVEYYLGNVTHSVYRKWDYYTGIIATHFHTLKLGAAVLMDASTGDTGSRFVESEGVSLPFHFSFFSTGGTSKSRRCIGSDQTMLSSQ